jgi:GNAT superfamily N-acetyltransferase
MASVVDTASGAALQLPGLCVQALQPQDAPALQAFYEANPEHFDTVDGTAPPATAAADDLTDRPPPDMPWRERWFLGIDHDAAPAGTKKPGPSVAVAEVVSDLLAPGVWHIGLLIVATPQWGSGLAGRVVQGLEDWARRAGADWMRLGVVEVNARGLRFWQGQGYTVVRTREQVPFGAQTHRVLVMVKALQARTLTDYLERVPRDRPPEDHG